MSWNEYALTSSVKPPPEMRFVLHFSFKKSIKSCLLRPEEYYKHKTIKSTKLSNKMYSIYIQTRKLLSVFCRIEEVKIFTKILHSQFWASPSEILSIIIYSLCVFFSGQTS